jgi:hypothetical protein
MTWLDVVRIALCCTVTCRFVLRHHYHLDSDQEFDRAHGEYGATSARMMLEKNLPAF